MNIDVIRGDTINIQFEIDSDTVLDQAGSEDGKRLYEQRVEAVHHCEGGRVDGRVFFPGRPGEAAA